MRFGIGERERAAPGTAEQQELLDAEMFAQRLDIGDQVGCGIVGQFAAGGRTAGAALIVDDDPVGTGIEKPPMHRRRPGTGAAMEKDHRNAAGMAGLFPVHRVNAVERKPAGLIRFD